VVVLQLFHKAQSVVVVEEITTQLTQAVVVLVQGVMALVETMRQVQVQQDKEVTVALVGLQEVTQVAEEAAKVLSVEQVKVNK
jgi:hypothetical protein